MKVQTTHGLVERSTLTTKDEVREDDATRVTATEWYLNNELVRRDVWVNALRGVECDVEAARMAGA